MFDSLKNFFHKRSLASLEIVVSEIDALESQIAILRDEDFALETGKLKNRLLEGENFDAILPRAFALAREAAKRTLGQRPYDVQLLGGVALHEGSVAEMMTGEGKTLSAVAPAYTNALMGKGVHVVTVNEYLARRDAVWMGQIYRFLGLRVACIVPGGAFVYDPLYRIPEPAFAEAVPAGKGRNGMSMKEPSSSPLAQKEENTTGSFLVQQEFLRPVSRREAYLADITYGTNHEFGFDYLRDNLAYQLEGQVQRGHYFAIIDEVDSILIDEARTPLIIAAPDAQSSDFYKTFARVTDNLKKDEDYEVDEKRKSATVTDVGIAKVEKILGVANLYAPENIRLVHYLEESIKAKALFFKDRDYVVKNGEIIIVDEFTGRLLLGRRYQAGLHQAIEAKEGVTVKEESRTYAKISIQNYFRMYEKISGMTGTGQTSAEEFHKVYELDVVSIPPNRPCVRDDMNDVIYRDFNAKVKAVVREVAERHKKGQPVLLGTTSISKNEVFSAALSAAHISHEVLNAKNNEREGAIIAQAGRRGGVTVATNVAGRGVDILLGGNPPDPEEAEEVKKLGGLHVIGTERHEARRIDNQLRGRAGRQGDAGSSQFFLSLEDDLLRIFGGGRIKGMMERFDLPEDEPIAFGFVTKAVAQAQEKVEGSNFDLRKHLLEYDDVLNKQRGAIYKRRREILEAMDKETVAKMIFDAAYAAVDHMQKGVVFTEEELRDSEKAMAAHLRNTFLESGLVKDEKELPEAISSAEDVKDILERASFLAAENPVAKNQLLGILDMLWMTNLEDLEALAESVGLRAYGQRDPLVEYRQEASRLFKVFWDNFNTWIFMNIFRLANSDSPLATRERQTQKMNPNPLFHGETPVASGGSKVGRNDPCICGSGRKWKQCGLLNTEEHRANMGKKHEVTGG
jgi:preprotein translocase subunit SecA